MTGTATGTATGTGSVTGAGPELSVLTVTRGRRAILARKLEALAGQTLAPERFELVAFVNGDPDSAADLRAARPRFALTVLESPDNLGAAAGRNACARAARSPVLLLSDDDALPAPDGLERHLAAQARAPGVWLGAVRWEAPDGSSTLLAPARPRWWNLHGVDASLPAALLARVGGFDEWLDGYGFEDVLLGRRLHLAGERPRLLPGAPARHIGADPHASGDPVKAALAGRNAVRAARRHPELAFRFGVHPAALGVKRALLPLLERLGPRGRGEAAFVRAALDERRAGPSGEGG